MIMTVKNPIKVIKINADAEPFNAVPARNAYR